MTRFVDAHLHLWDRGRFTYPWLEHEPSLPVRFTPTELPEAAASATAAVFVQADCRADQGLQEAAWAAAFAASWPALRAVVAFAPLELGDLVREHLDRLRAVPLVAGVRRLLQDEPDELLEGPGLRTGLRHVAAAGLPFDACVRHGQLERLVALRRAVPEVVLVLDHLGKPPVAAGWGSPPARRWLERIRALAREPRTYVKLSGVAPEAGAGPVLERSRPFVAAALEAFGAERAMAGSDWPVSGAPAGAVGYGDWFRFLHDGLGLSAPEREAVLVGTATRVYLGEPRYAPCAAQ